MLTLLVVVLIVAVLSLVLNAAFILHELGWFPHGETSDSKGVLDAWRLLSAQTHGAFVGEHVTLSPEEGRIKFGRPLVAKEQESTANLARRLLLPAFMEAWQALDGPIPIPLSSPNPEIYRAQ